MHSFQECCARNGIAAEFQNPFLQWSGWSAFERIGAILKAASMTFDDIVRLTVYVTDKSIFEQFFRVREETMGNHNPPAILLTVDEFPRAGVAVEIEAIAAKPE